MGDIIYLNGSGSYDNIGVTNYTWIIKSESDDIVLFGVNSEIKLNAIGNYTLTLTVMDGSGNIDNDTTYLLVIPKITDISNVVEGNDYLWYILIVILFLIILVVIFGHLRKRRFGMAKAEIEEEDEK